ncbi:MAG: D-sedoheptulose-7-phosphate isomerase [Polyangiales bacterium]
MSAENEAWRDHVRAHLVESSVIKRRAADSCGADAASAARLIVESVRRGGKLLLCGNGGSAADCQHIAAEFTSALSLDFSRPAIAAIALTTDTSFLTASANDFGFEIGFARQVEALGRSGDVLLGISTSGNSANVLRAVSRAKEIGMQTIAFTGETGGKLAAVVDVNVRVPSKDTQHIQETHIAIAHAVCMLVERALFREGQGS